MTTLTQILLANQTPQDRKQTEILTNNLINNETTTNTSTGNSAAKKTD